MKIRFKTLIISFLLLGLYSCIEDDSSTLNEDNTEVVNTNSSAIEGTWSMSSYSVSNGNVVINVTGFGNISQSFTVSSNNYNYTETYNDDSSEVTIDGTFDVSAIIAGITTETINHTVDTSTMDTSFLVNEWELENGNSVIITNGDIETTYSIIEISDSILKYTVDLSTLNADQINIFFGDEIAERFDDGTFSSMTGDLYVTLEM